MHKTMRGGQKRFGNGPHKEEGKEDDHERPGLITSRRPWQQGTLMSKISRTVRGGEEVARNVRKGCRTLDDEEETMRVLCSNNATFLDIIHRSIPK
jgi:hypothetical protein